MWHMYIPCVYFGTLKLFLIFGLQSSKSVRRNLVINKVLTVFKKVLSDQKIVFHAYVKLHELERDISFPFELMIHV